MSSSENLGRNIEARAPGVKGIVEGAQKDAAHTYSVCMLCSNDGETVDESVRSVLQLSQYRRVEVVVVDNLSTDGSEDSLQRMRDSGWISLIGRRCTRGEGRQLAFDASKGDYVLSHMDCDDIFDAKALDSLITRYHSDFEGRALMTKKRESPEASNITIAPRKALELVGGWRSLNWGEDWDLWARLASAGLYSFMPYPSDNPPHKSIRVRTERFTGPTRGFRVRVSKYADALRIGRRVFDPGEHISSAQRLALAVARAGVAIRGNQLVPVRNPDFAEFRDSHELGGDMAPTYSVCMTCYNEVSTVRDSLNSLLGQLDENYEVVIVDNFSGDGTYDLLREFERDHKVKVIRKRCSRGLGRQIAFENAAGKYIIANLDLDDIFLPVIEKIVAAYHATVEGNLVAIFNFPDSPNDKWVQNITIGPREFISSLGGWRDLNVFEDWDIWSRADRVHKYGWSFIQFAANETLHPEPKKAFMRLQRRYGRYRERLRLGMRIFSADESTGASQKLAYVGARLSLLRHGVLKGQDPNFDPLDVRLCSNSLSEEVRTLLALQRAPVDSTAAL